VIEGKLCLNSHQPLTRTDPRSERSDRDRSSPPTRKPWPRSAHTSSPPHQPPPARPRTSRAGRSPRTRCTAAHTRDGPTPGSDTKTRGRNLVVSRTTPAPAVLGLLSRLAPDHHPDTSFANDRRHVTGLEGSWPAPAYPRLQPVPTVCRVDSGCGGVVMQRRRDSGSV